MSFAPLGTLRLNLQAVVLHFDVEVVAEEAMEPAGQLLRLREIVAEDELAELAGGAAGEADQPVVVRFEQLLVDTGNMVETLGVGERRHLDEVLEAGLVLGQQREVVGGIATALAVTLGAPARGNVRLVADDRIESGSLAFLVELDGAEEIAVIGEGAGVHALGLDVGDELRDPARAVEEAVVGMAVEMDEGSFSHGVASS